MQSESNWRLLKKIQISTIFCRKQYGSGIDIEYEVLFCYPPPPPTRKFNLILKERKTFAPGMHISILKERKRLIV